MTLNLKVLRIEYVDSKTESERSNLGKKVVVCPGSDLPPQVKEPSYKVQIGYHENLQKMVSRRALNTEKILIGQQVLFAVSGRTACEPITRETVQAHPSFLQAATEAEHRPNQCRQPRRPLRISNEGTDEYTYFLLFFFFFVNWLIWSISTLSYKTTFNPMLPLSLLFEH